MWCLESISTWQDIFYLPFHMVRDQTKRFRAQKWLQSRYAPLDETCALIISVLHANLFSLLHGTLSKLHRTRMTILQVAQKGVEDLKWPRLQVDSLSWSKKRHPRADLFLIHFCLLLHTLVVAGMKVWLLICILYVLKNWWFGVHTGYKQNIWDFRADSHRHFFFQILIIWVVKKY